MSRLADRCNNRICREPFRTFARGRSGDRASGITVRRPHQAGMTAQEYLDSLDLTQVGAAAFLGVNGVTSWRWATEKAEVPQATAMLLRLMVAMKLSPEKEREWLKDA